MPEKRGLRRPPSFRLCTSVAARHGVVEKALGRIAAYNDLEALAMALKAVAEFAHVGDRLGVTGFAIDGVDRALDLLDQLLERPRVHRTHAKILRGSPAIPN